MATVPEKSGMTPVDPHIPTLRRRGTVLADGVTAPATLGNSATIYIDVADGDLKVKFASGNVAVLAAD